jgi:ABC-type transport system involved in multi-copper enzyme maturation permease subunit
MLNRALMRLGFRQLMRTKKFFFAALISLVPLVAGILMILDDAQDQSRSSYQFDDGFTETTAFLLVIGTVPFVALMLAGGHLADEAEDRTLTYLLVRPVPRSTLYLSRYVPVAAVAAALAMAQVVLLALMRMLAYAFVGEGRIAADSGDHTYHPVLLILRLLPTSMLAVALEAIILTALFGLVSLITTRFHFFVNLVLVLLDVVFGSFGGRGLGGLAVTYWVRSMLQTTDPTTSGLVPDAVIWPLVPIWLALWTAALLAIGVRQVRRRDFNITSAAT